MTKYSEPSDPKGLIFEAYRIPNITEKDRRTIFFDWVLNLEDVKDPIAEINYLYNKYGILNDKHPMSVVLKEGSQGFSASPKRARKRKKLIR